MRRLLAEAVTHVAVAALPLFGGRPDRALIYMLLSRRTRNGNLPTPVLAMADSLGIPFETTRRHVGVLANAGLCRRLRGGMVATPVIDDAPAARFADLIHDCVVHFIARLAAIDALPHYPVPTRGYDRDAGLQVCVDLMLSLMHSSAALFSDRLDLLLHAAIVAANAGRINADDDLSRRYAAAHQVPPLELLRPVRIRQLAHLLGLSEATVRRRLKPLYGRVFHNMPEGLLVDEHWHGSAATLAVVERSAGDLRRALGALANHGFPFHDPSLAYRRGPPRALPIG